MTTHKSIHDAVVGGLAAVWRKKRLKPTCRDFRPALPKNNLQCVLLAGRLGKTSNYCQKRFGEFLPKEMQALIFASFYQEKEESPLRQGEERA